MFLVGGLLALVSAGCGPALVGLGADLAASGADRGTTRVAAGGSPGVGAAAAVGVGVAAMAAGYALTPDDSRRPTAAQPQQLYTPSHRQPPRRASHYP